MEPENNPRNRKRVPLFDPDSPLQDTSKAVGITLAVLFLFPFVLTWPIVLIVGGSSKSEDIAAAIVFGGYIMLAVWAVFSIVRHLMRLNMRIQSIVLWGLFILSTVSIFFFLSFIVSSFIFMWRYGFD